MVKVFFFFFALRQASAEPTLQRQSAVYSALPTVAAATMATRFSRLLRMRRKTIWKTKIYGNLGVFLTCSHTPTASLPFHLMTLSLATARPVSAPRSLSGGGETFVSLVGGMHVFGVNCLSCE